MTDFKQTLTIKLEHSDGESSVSYTVNGGLCGNDQIFWLWLKDAFPAVGLQFVTDELFRED